MTDAEVAQTAECLVAEIRRRSRMNLAEIIMWLRAQGIPTEGDLEWHLGKDQPNIIIWSGMSDEMSAIIDHIWPSDVLEWHSENPLCYFYDGAGLNLPVLKTPPHGQRKTRCWLPVAFCPKRGV